MNVRYAIPLQNGQFDKMSNEPVTEEDDELDLICEAIV